MSSKWGIIEYSINLKDVKCNMPLGKKIGLVHRYLLLRNAVKFGRF